MNGWERLVEWAATLVVASLAWVSGIAAPVAPTDRGLSAAERAPLLLAWAQDATEPPIEAVDDADVETLDQGASPSDAPQLVSETQTGDDVPLDPTGAEDVETLDQGAPPAQPVPVEPVATDAAPASAPVAAPAPAPVSAPAPAPTGPVLPPGFGTGRVQVSAGSAGFPEGLADCHVGAVTGRAFVGIDCGDGASFVGHAPSFADFPFLVEPPFPFDSSDEVVLDPPVVAEDGQNDVFVSAGGGGGANLDDEPATPEVGTAGSSSVGLYQRSRDHEPRVRSGDRETRPARSGKKDGDAQVNSQRSGGSANAVQTQSARQEAKNDKNNKKNGDKNKDRKHGKGKKHDRDKKHQKRSSQRS